MTSRGLCLYLRKSMIRNIKKFLKTVRYMGEKGSWERIIIAWIAAILLYPLRELSPILFWIIVGIFLYIAIWKIIGLYSEQQ